MICRGDVGCDKYEGDHRDDGCAYCHSEFRQPLFREHSTSWKLFTFLHDIKYSIKHSSVTWLDCLMLMLRIYTFLRNIRHWQINDMSARYRIFPKICDLSMFCTKELKFALINAPASIAVLIERLSSLGSWGNVSSNLM